MPNVITIESTDLAAVMGGQDVNDYGDLSSLVPHDPEQHGMSPTDRTNKFLYGGYMDGEDREALIHNWVKSNEGNAPAQMDPLSGVG
jgi:hypothetical protein